MLPIVESVVNQKHPKSPGLGYRFVTSPETDSFKIVSNSKLPEFSPVDKSVDYEPYRYAAPRRKPAIPLAFRDAAVIFTI